MSAPPPVPGSHAEECAKILRNMKQRQRQAHGHQGQAVVSATMKRLGFLFVQEIHTGMKLAGGRYVFARKVAGDVTAVLPGGRSTLCEIKSRLGKLALCDLEPHQQAALTEHAQAGGLSLVAWLAPSGVYIMDWTIVSREMTKGHPLSEDAADLLAIKRLPL